MRNGEAIICAIEALWGIRFFERSKHNAWERALRNSSRKCENVKYVPWNRANRRKGNNEIAMSENDVDVAPIVYGIGSGGSIQYERQ